MALECGLKDLPCSFEWIAVCFKPISEFGTISLVCEGARNSRLKTNVKACLLLQNIITSNALINYLPHYPPWGYMWGK